MQETDVLIVGAGHAGAQCAAALRQKKFDGKIMLVGDEPELPYERPPLSKDFLAGEKPFERILIRPESFWTRKEIDLVTGVRVNKVDAPAHRVELSNGESVSYGSLVWAAGGAPRRLTCPGADLDGIHVIRARADVDALKEDIEGRQNIAVVGGGYIGLEAAAVLSKLGKSVVVLEAMERVLARVAGPQISEFYEREHGAQGVDIRTGAGVVALSSTSQAHARVSCVTLDDGTELTCDAVIVGIGILPAVQPLLDAGAKGGNGVDVDALCQTSLPDVFAIGDCAAHANRYGQGATLRLESVQNANDQAMTVAKAITGAPEPYDAVPWFWSNQYDLKLQTVGLSLQYDNTLVRGDVAARSFSVVYLKDGTVIALDCVNAARDYAQGKALVQSDAKPDLARLADAEIPLKDLL